MPTLVRECIPTTEDPDRMPIQIPESPRLALKVRPQPRANPTAQKPTMLKPINQACRPSALQTTKPLCTGPRTLDSRLRYVCSHSARTSLTVQMILAQRVCNALLLKYLTQPAVSTAIAEKPLLNLINQDCI